MIKTREQISYNMKRVKSKDTKIELLLRKELWNRKLRYRKNYKELPGKPDIVFLREKIAVFCDSEFWHGYDWVNRREDIKTNREFWIAKIERNRQKDIEVTRELELLGYAVIRFWGNEIKHDCKSCASIIEGKLRGK